MQTRMYRNKFQDTFAKETIFYYKGFKYYGHRKSEHWQTNIQVVEALYCSGPINKHSARDKSKFRICTFCLFVSFYIYRKIDMYICTTLQCYICTFVPLSCIHLYKCSFVTLYNCTFAQFYIWTIVQLNNCTFAQLYI